MMNKTEIPQRVIDAVTARLGTPHPHANLDPSKTALIVIDLQNGFMMDDVAHALCVQARAIVPNVNKLAEAVRATGGQVYWIQNTHDETCLESWSNLHAMTPPAKVAKRIESMSPGGIGHQLWAELDVKEGDRKVLKNRYSAFVEGSSELHAILQAEGIDTLLITGTVTNVCCESSARDAMMLNYKVVMVTDGNAAVTDMEHNAALSNFYLTFGDIFSTDELVDILHKNAGVAQVAAE
ncbi:isochorismatase family cysteine hydrolase [Thalassobaculum sp. OXR-137]|uniref:isochorismatase family cysteine hydrolase n=1 Tax=Thalassobaculum sp. OXR-137 TaxID=3100173 RepID=UPI002AC918D1|nr:isochorismatase family cysteine hydrolase [Thalassobaculum sp. OXR-137]WPZ33869.1 isochorismatase family cysteine hydrolase [Thalassobaculum sp. OXR-137]